MLVKAQLAFDGSENTLSRPHAQSVRIMAAVKLHKHTCFNKSFCKESGKDEIMMLHG
jgi:hypothetical protein